MAAEYPGRLLTPLLGSCIDIGRDALGDLSGHSMPYRADRIASPQALSRWINDAAVQPFDRPVNITAIEQQDIPSVSSNCVNLVLSLEQAGEPVLPDSVFLKLPMTSLATRWFMNIIGAWRLESYFFRELATQVPIRTPKTYATASRGSRFFLLQENLHQDASVRLFTNFDMDAGPPLSTVRACLDTFARLHGHFYGLESAQQERLLPRDYHLFLSRRTGGVARNLNRFALSPCLRKCPDLIPADIAQVYRQSLRDWQELLQFWFSGPLSLLHGDSHLGNFYEVDGEMGMLDFQAVHWGKGIRDVQYFLINSLPAEVLAEHERELVDYYVDRRGVHGQAIDAQVTWQEYRSLSFHTLFTLVTSVGLGALNEEQDQLMKKLLARAVAAVQRVDYPGWFRDFIAAQR